MRIDNDEPFIRNVEGLIDPTEVSDLLFFSSIRKLLPAPVFRRVLERTSRKYPRMGFVIEPYCLFLFFRIRDQEKARAQLPERFEMIPAKVFDEDPAEYFYGMGIFNTRASTFWGSRLESYLIARDKETGVTSWIFSGILSNTIIAHPGLGIASPNVPKALYTTNSRGELFIDFMDPKTGKGIELKGNLTRGKLRPLEQDLWIMGNTSIGFTKDFGGTNDDPFAVIFDPAEVEAALDIPLADLELRANTLLPDYVDPALCKAVCFPYAQHYMADSPGLHTRVRNPADMVGHYRDIAAMQNLRSFSVRSLKVQFLVGMIVPLVLSIVLLSILILR